MLSHRYNNTRNKIAYSAKDPHPPYHFLYVREIRGVEEKEEKEKKEAWVKSPFW